MRKIPHFLSITDLSAAEFWQVLKLSKRLKDEHKKTGLNKTLFKNKTLIMIFEKPSLRTRISFESGMTHLGGHAIFLGPSDIGMGSREEPRDGRHACRRDPPPDRRTAAQRNSEADRENGKGLPAGGSISLHAAPEGQQSW